jgi:quinol---cytochrome c reductase iron-sulfur subunit, bacillus type
LSIWPVGVAAGVAALLVGLLVSWWIVAAGALALIVFGVGWAADVSRERRPAAPAAPPEAGKPVARASVGDTPATRKTFLSAATLGLGAAIGAIVTIPPLVFAGLPPFKKNEGFFDMDVDLGPLENFPEGKWFITKFNAEPTRGDVYDRTAFVRFNGFVEKEPSFTIISNRCVHLGCPVQANGPLDGTPKEMGSGHRKVSLTGVTPAGFGCPCHGGQYDIEGNRTAGPPVRALDRYAYKIKNGRLRLVGAFSVNAVNGSGSEAEMGRYRLAQPGVHIDGVEQILYPFIPPS